MKSKNSKDRLQTLRKSFQNRVTLPVVSILAKTGITPNTITWIGFLVILAAGALAATGHLFAAGWVLLLSGVFDILDGALARYTGKVTAFGGVLDSTLDRLSEGVILLGILAYFLYNPEKYAPWASILAVVVLIASFLVSYIRSRAEGASLDCQVGIFTRSERVIILALGLMIDRLLIILAIIAFLSIITVIQRLVHVSRRAGTIKK